MRITLMLSAFLGLLIAWSLHAQEEVNRLEKSVNFVVDVNPIGILVSPDVDGFTARRGTYSETVDGSLSYTHNLKLGVNFDTGPVDIDAMAGIGYLWNLAFDGSFTTAEVAVKFASDREGFTIGPHVGVISLADADWVDHEDIELEGNNGWFCGVVVTTGSKRVSFIGSLDYVDAEYDVAIEPGSGWTTSSSVVDISGWWLNVGVILRF